MREANAAVESEPGRRLILVFEEDSHYRSDDLFPSRSQTVLVVLVTLKSIVVLPVDVQSTAKTVFAFHDRE
jgi:hypothetical protein